MSGLPARIGPPMWHDAEHRIEKAIARFEEGDLRAAQSMLRTLDRKGILSPRIDLYLAHCHLHEDRIDAARRRYRRAAAARPEDGAAWVGLGLCHARLGRLSPAIRAFRRAARLEPDRADAHCHLVHCYGLTDRLGLARRHARRALELDPECAFVHRNLALAYEAAGEALLAIESWKRFAAGVPGSPEAGVGIGRAYAALRRTVEARGAFVRALEGPEPAEAHLRAEANYGLGSIAREEGEAVESLERFRMALEADPSHDEARVRMAEALYDMDRAEEAWETLFPLRDRWASLPDAALLAAQVLHALGARRGALRLLRDLVQGDPEDPAGWRLLGAHLLAVRRPRAARAPLRLARRLCPDDPQAVRLQARAFARAGERKRATALLARAAHDCPFAEVGVHLDLAALFLSRGRPGKAERSLLRSLSVLPRSPDLWAAAAELALDRGALDLARARLRTALRTDPRHGPALALLVRWLLATNRYEQAANAGRAASRVLPASDRTILEQGRALILGGRPQEAAIVLRRYVLASPPTPMVIGFWGRPWRCTGAGRKPECRSGWRRRSPRRLPRRERCLQ